MTSCDYTSRATTPIWLTGFMGCGKSTLAPLLAECLNLPWLDTDAVLTQRLGKSIAEVFAQDGEAVFRQAEYQLLQELCTKPVTAQIIATGGGFLATPEAMARAKKVGLVIYLEVPIEILWQRIHTPSATPSPTELIVRPLAHQETAEAFDTFKHRFEVRKPIYSTAHIILNAGDGNPEALLETLNPELAQYGSGKA